MERDQLKGKQTPGEVAIASVTTVYCLNNGRPQQNRFTATVYKGRDESGDWITSIEQGANAALYAEAHNVANRTGMWAADMEARIKELEGALDDFLVWADIKDTGSIQAIRVRDCARVLLTK